MLTFKTDIGSNFEYCHVKKIARTFVRDLGAKFVIKGS